MSKSFLQDLKFMAEPFPGEDCKRGSTLANQEPFEGDKRRCMFDINLEISLSARKPRLSMKSHPAASKKLKLEKPRPSVSLCLCLYI